MRGKELVIIDFPLGRKGDLLILHSTSGESENLIRAAAAARAADIETIALLAKGGGRLLAQVDHALVVPNSTHRPLTKEMIAPLEAA